MTDIPQQPAAQKPAGRLKRWYEDPLVVPIVFVVFLADVATKFAVRHALGFGNQWPDWDLPIRLFYTTNTGGAFGLFTGQAFALAVLSVFGVGVLLFIYRQQQTPNPFLRLSLGLQLGGALGNLYERLFFGHVTDFISVGWWPVFNLADSSIVVGIAVLAWFIAFPPRARAPVAPEPAAESPSALLPTADPPSTVTGSPLQDPATPQPISQQEGAAPNPAPASADSHRETPREPSVG